MNFKELGIGQPLIEGLKKEKIITPTGVQEAVYGKIIEHKDIIVQSETGSGKTLAYLLPLYEKIIPSPQGMKVLILVPTHELAMQVHGQIQRLTQNSGLPVLSAVIFGNVNIKRQIEQLKKKPQIIVGTTGRILELIRKRKITAHTIQTIVIDEADKMLDENNREAAGNIIKCCMRDTQLLFFTASLNKKVTEHAQALAKKPEIIRKSEQQVIPSNIKHMYLLVERRDKTEYVRKLAHSLKPERAMVFINKVSDIEEATDKLKYHHYKADCIHGTTPKNNRKQIMESFRNGKLQFLVATDLAARGLHVEGVSAVFHVTIPEKPVEYLHRAGRAGRGQKEGISVLLVTKEELSRIRAFEKAFQIKMTPMRLYQGKLLEEKVRLDKSKGNRI